MAVHAITQSRFDAFVENTRNPMVKLISEERAWFATDGEKVLGAVIYDKSDEDWSYVVMAKGKDQQFRWIAGNVSLPSQEEATKQLKTAMEKAATP